MALTPEQIKDEASHHGFIGNTDQLVKFARAIEAEVRAQDDALILQLVEALESLVACHEEPDCPAVTIGKEATTAGRAWLEGKP